MGGTAGEKRKGKCPGGGQQHGRRGPGEEMVVGDRTVKLAQRSTPKGAVHEASVYVLCWGRAGHLTC